MATDKDRLINHGDGQDIAKAIENVAKAIEGQTAVTFDKSKATWGQWQNIIRSGKAKEYLSVGDQFEVNKESSIVISSSNSELKETIDPEMFVEKMDRAETSDYEFEYDGVAWHYNGTAVVLSEYGITVTGNPKNGDIINVAETATKVIFDVLDLGDKDTPVDSNRIHSVPLLAHYADYPVVFSASQALFAFPDGLKAGNYCFNIISSYNRDLRPSGNTMGQKYYFTLSKDIPANGQIFLSFPYQQDPDGNNITTYAGPESTAAIETAKISVASISGATDLGEADGSKLKETTVGGVKVNINSVDRCRYGSNDWALSAVRQWLNSDQPKGKVWHSKSQYDRPPSWANSLDGFLYGLDPEFRKIVLPVVKKTRQCTAVVGTQEPVSSNENIWLLGMGEMGVVGWEDEGTGYQYFNDIMGGAAINDWNRYTQLIKTDTKGAAQYWWTDRKSVV